MTFTARDGSGALFKNADKRDSDSPDYSGRIVIGGVEHQLNAWVREAKSDGRKYLAISARPKPAAPTAKPAPARYGDRFRDEGF
jgi:hypothetical protein